MKNAAPQAKVKKRKTLKQVLQEKDEQARDKALKREQEKTSLKEVRIHTILYLVIGLNALVGSFDP